MRNVWMSVQILARPNALSADIKDASGWEDESDRDLPHLPGVLRSANGTKMYINVTEQSQKNVQKIIQSCGLTSLMPP